MELQKLRATTKQNQNGMGGRKGLRKVWPGSDKVVPHNKAPVPFFGGVLFVLHPRNSSRWALAKTCLVEEKWEEGELSQPQLINFSFAYPHKHPLEGEYLYLSHKNLSVTDKLVPLRRRVDWKYDKAGGEAEEREWTWIDDQQYLNTRVDWAQFIFVFNSMVWS